MLSKLLSTQEVADLLSASKDYVLDRIRDGRLPASKIAGRYKVTQTDFEEFVRSYRRGGK